MKLDREKLKSAAKVVGQAAATILLRVVGWGALGAALGAFAAIVLLVSPALSAPQEVWRWARFLVVPFDVACGAVIFGHLGVARGVARVVLHHAVDRGLVVSVLDRLLELCAARIDGDPRLAPLLAKADAFAAELPLGDYERLFKQAGARFIGGDDLEDGARGPRRWLLRKIKRALFERIEAYTLRVVRAEPGGVSLSRVRQLALDEVEGAVREMIFGAMKKHTLMAAAALLLAFALGPAIAFSLRIS